MTKEEPMSPTQIVVIVLVVLVIAAVLAVAARSLNSRRALRNRFGPEYDRVVAEQDSRSAAERELRDRERRHAELKLTPLTPESRARYAAAWEELQVRFVDSPGETVGDADELVTRLIAERGYPTGDFSDQIAHLSVEHARTLDPLPRRPRDPPAQLAGRGQHRGAPAGGRALPGTLRRPARRGAGRRTARAEQRHHPDHDVTSR